MAGVHCPTCEALVDAVAKFCLACGHDFTGQGPITSTGHDLAQLKDVIRQRDDLSMAEKFDMIAKIEEGANPITLGVAASGDDDGVDIGEAFSVGGADGSSKSDWSFGNNQGSSAAVKAVMKATKAWDLIKSGDLNLGDSLFRDAMGRGMDASTHIHDVASGEGEGVDPEAMRNIPVLKPPKRSFCPKCGSDIHNNTMLQWRKWRDHSSDVVSMQLEASMETALIHVAAHYVGGLAALKEENASLESRLEEIDEEKVKSEMKEKLVEELREELKEELRDEIEDEVRGQIEKDVRGSMASKGGASRGGVSQTTSGSTTGKKVIAKKPAGGMFGAKKVVKKYEGDDPAGKASWFLKDALDTIYDPHGTGKVVKRKTILARSADGNVRIEDVVKIYAKEGEEGLSELAWTSPLTKYIIEAYDSC